jgi:hypothetical protein
VVQAGRTFEHLRRNELHAQVQTLAGALSHVTLNPAPVRQLSTRTS